MYHSIESIPKSTVMKSLYVPPKKFKFQMFLLKLLGFKGLSLKDLKPYLDGEKQGKVVGITFDDGYQNNLTYAAPILKRFGFSATCYIVSGNIGSSNTWDLKEKIMQKALMTENEINQWLELGFDIGAHTKTHPDLTCVSDEQALIEINDCKIELEEKFNVTINDFCYPFGRFNDFVLNVLKGSDYATATTMQRGRVNVNSNKYLLPRIPVNYRTLPHLFIAKILTSYEDNK